MSDGPIGRAANRAHFRNAQPTSRHQDVRIGIKCWLCSTDGRNAGLPSRSPTGAPTGTGSVRPTGPRCLPLRFVLPEFALRQTQDLRGGPGARQGPGHIVSWRLRAALCERTRDEADAKMAQSGITDLRSPMLPGDSRQSCRASFLENTIARWQWRLRTSLHSGPRRSDNRPLRPPPTAPRLRSGGPAASANQHRQHRNRRGDHRQPAGQRLEHGLGKPFTHRRL